MGGALLSAPTVVDHVGHISHCAGIVVGVQRPLKGSRGAGTGTSAEGASGDPLGVESQAYGVAGVLLQADHRAHHVGAVGGACTIVGRGADAQPSMGGGHKQASPAVAEGRMHQVHPGVGIHGESTSTGIIPLPQKGRLHYPQAHLCAIGHFWTVGSFYNHRIGSVVLLLVFFHHFYPQIGMDECQDKGGFGFYHQQIADPVGVHILELVGQLLVELGDELQPGGLRGCGFVDQQARGGAHPVLEGGALLVESLPQGVHIYPVGHEQAYHHKIFLLGGVGEPRHQLGFHATHLGVQLDVKGD